MVNNKLINTKIRKIIFEFKNHFNEYRLNNFLIKTETYYSLVIVSFSKPLQLKKHMLVLIVVVRTKDIGNEYM